MFMNQENQQRLVRMRSECDSRDCIDLIYDKRLLNEESIKQLQEFCTANRINPIDVKTELFSQCKTNREKQLMALYEKEIQHLNEGGNLAAASDILRRLEPAFTRGVYTDFDNIVQTKTLPPYMNIDSDFLLNAGSYYTQEGKENFVFNNDIIAVINPDALGIRRAQKYILDAYRPIDIKKWFDTVLYTDEKDREAMKGYYDKACETIGTRCMDPIEYRANIPNIMDNIRCQIQQSFLNNDEKKEKLIAHTAFFGEKLYMNSVIWASGPCASYKLFSDNDNNDRKKKSSLFSYKALFNAFYSSQALVLGAKDRSSIHHRSEGVKNDVSWMVFGEKKVQEREKKFNAAQKITHFFKEIQRKKTKKSDDGDEKPVP